MSGRVVSGKGWSLHEGDAIDRLSELPDNSFDASLSDPPYGYSFMGKAWDYDVPSVEFWRELLRVLKPGAPILAFGGPRTFHRLAVAMEDAGAELRDVIAWIHVQGFPKSLAVDKAIDKRRDDEAEVRVVCRFLRRAMDARGCSAATLASAFGMHSRMVDHWAARDTDSQPTLPTWDQWLRVKDLLGLGDEMDPEVWRLNGRKGNPGEAWSERPVVGTVTLPDARHSSPGFAAMTAPDGKARQREVEITTPATALAHEWAGYGTALKPAYEPIILARKPLDGTMAQNVARWGVGGVAIDACRIEYASALGRWPANVVLDDAAANELDEQSGDRPGMSGGGAHAADYAGGMFGAIDAAHTARADGGGISRMFYVAKPDRFERELGCEALPHRTAGECTQRAEAVNGDDDRRAAGLNSPRAGANRGRGARNVHPTLKAISLTKYLATLILPPRRSDDATRRLVVPFAGSGSEMIGARRAGWDDVVGIEREAEYVAIAAARLARWEEIPAHLSPDDVKPAERVDERQVSLFGKAVGT